MLNLILTLAAWGTFALAEETTTAPATPPAETATEYCGRALAKLPGKPTLPGAVEKICGSVAQIAACKSAEGMPIFHWQTGGAAATEATPADGKDKPLKILVFGLIHGDEPESGSLVRLWSERLTKFSPNNSWRMVPILNPDGLKRMTRTNANGVDVNRNFPTKDWKSHAVTHWERDLKKNPRRFPGKEAGSEPETLCALAQIEDFKPDFVISVHTPYGLLDLDGPNAGQLKKMMPLPWKRLGTLPGSLGRYLWDERQLPVLTIELKGAEPIHQRPRFEGLQDDMSRIFWAASDAQYAEKKSPPGEESVNSRQAAPRR